VLEVGCGTGNVLRVLQSACRGGTVVGMDLFEEGLRFARSRLPDAKLVVGDAMRPPFSTRFEIVGLFDVLEHITNDVEVLAALRQLLTADGTLMMTVPAGPGLWSYFDEAAQHVRRYAAGELAEKLGAAGFEVQFLSPYMASLYPALWLGRRLASGRDRKPPTGGQRTRRLVDQELRVNPLVGATLKPLLELERLWLRRRRRLPTGSSLIAVARRTGSVC
jgi:SAM-dependent methyltransferase